MPCAERFLKDKAADIKMSALKNMHIFLKEVGVDKRSSFIKYIVQTFDEAGKNEWRLKEILAKNLGNYAEIFEPNTVYTEFLPMFFKFCSDNVVRVAYSCCPALASIIAKFNDDDIKQSTIVRVIKTKYLKAKTYKKRQLFAMMMINIMQKKEIFEKHFKLDFLNMVNDRVPNVRICVAKTLRHHFVKEISGEFVYDTEVMGAVRVLKLDTCEDVKS